MDRTQRVTLLTDFTGSGLLMLYASTSWHRRSYGLVSFIVVDLLLIGGGGLLAWYVWRQDRPGGVKR